MLFKNITLLGIILLTASAVIAGLSNKADKKISNNGLLGQFGTDDGNTCRGIGSQCTKTLDTTTTEDEESDSYADGKQTIDNTSDGINQSVLQ